MSIQTDMRAAFGVLKASQPELVVQVACAGTTANGIRNTQRMDADLGSGGNEVGLTANRVHVSLADMSVPPRGAAITVAGAEAIVTAVNTDSAGALMVIEYQLQRPVVIDPNG